MEKITTAENPSEALWKTLDNAQSLIGRKSIPAPDAPDDQWQQYYNQLRPESADKYNLPDIEGMPEGADLSAQKTRAMGLFHKVGLSQKQAEALWKDYLTEELQGVNQLKTQQQAQEAALDKEFDEISAKVFGDKYSEKEQAAQEMIRQHVPEELRPALDDVAKNPKALAAVISALSAASEQIAKVKAEYGAEDKISGNGGQIASSSLEDMRKELAALRTSQAARDFTHPDNRKTLDRINALSGTVQRALNKS